jgi:hypothetical protein
VCAEHHLEPDSIHGLGVVLLREPGAPGPCPPDQCPQAVPTAAPGPGTVTANPGAAGEARSCECLMVYVGRGSSCPVLCIVVVDNRQPSGNTCSSQSHWLCGCRQVVGGLRCLLGW